MKVYLKYAEKEKKTGQLVSLSYRNSYSLKQELKAKKKPGCYLLSRECSIIGVGGLNFRVRDGNGCDTSTMATKQE